MSEERFRIFHSKVVSFERCRKQYWFRYVSDFQQPPERVTAEGLIGNAVHRGMATLCNTGYADDGANEMDAYLRMPAHEVAGPGTEANRIAFELYQRGCDAHDSIASDSRWAELEGRFPFHGALISTRIDRADRFNALRWQVIDWKTGTFDIDDQVDRQLDIGHVALRVSQRLPLEATVTAIAWNLRTGRQRVRELRRADAAATVYRLEHMAEQMQATTEFGAMPGAACRFCEWRDRCVEAAYVEAGKYDWLEE